MKVSIVAPCYEEAETIISFLNKLEKAISGLPHDFEIVLVDDGSQDETISLVQAFSFKKSNIRLHLLSLPFNMGHQKAIYQGLSYVQQTDAERIIIMDADGEDDPTGIPFLLENKAEIVQVKRGKRQASPFFKTAYFFYQLLYFIISKERMQVGNFCMIGRQALLQAGHHGFVHLAAFLQKLPLSRSYIQLDRGKRIAGKSKMASSQLVEHGLMALVERAPDLLRLFFKLFLWMMFFLIIGGIFVLYHKFFTGKAILGWTSTLMIGLMNLALVSLGFFVLGTLLLKIQESKKDQVPSIKREL